MSASLCTATTMHAMELASNTQVSQCKSMLRVLEPFTKKEIKDWYLYRRPTPPESQSGHWSQELVLSQVFTQRLKISPKEIKKFALKRLAVDCEMQGHLFLVACCVAAGADVESPLSAFPHGFCMPRDTWHLEPDVVASMLLRKPTVSMLSWAVENDATGFVSTIAPWKPNPNRHQSERYKDLSQPIFFLAKSTEMCALLYQLGADYKLRGGFGNGTLLHFLGTYGFAKQLSPKVLKFYLEHGADLNVIDDNGQTPLHLLAERSYLFDRYENKLIKVAFLFLLAGADGNVINPKTGKSALDSARDARNLRSSFSGAILVKLLISSQNISNPQEKLHALEREAIKIREDLSFAQLL